MVYWFGAVTDMDEQWALLKKQIDACGLCGLCAGRTNAVMGDGNPGADILFVGEGPGAEEDAQGLPFVGAAGKLLDRMMAAIGLNRQNCYIANIVKCRPPGNRTPSAQEAAACLPYLRAQVRLIRPKIIVALGATAARAIISPHTRISKDRGVWHESKGFHMIATYHPSYLLRDPTQKKDAWADLKSIRDKIRELDIPLETEGPHE